MKDESKNPFILHPSSFILYKTGDLGRYLPDGNIEFLGREDFQVKIRGYRIELGEIETALGQHPAVRLAAVNAVGEPRGSKRLVAYLVPNQTAPSVNELRSYLRDKLPEYMIPTHFIFLESLPLSSNGKVDRKALSALEGPDPTQAVTAVVETHAELPASALQVAKLVASVLKLDHIDPEMNLLDLGANSVDMIRVVNQLETELSFRPRIDEFYQSPTVASLARAYERQRSEKEAAASTPEQSEMARAAELLKKVRQLSPEEVKALLEANRT
jgi:acyl carrier protein